MILFQQRPGADRKLGVGKSLYKDGFPYGQPAGDSFAWGGGVAPWRGRVYARVTPKVGDGFVCRADRSRTIINGNICFEDPSFCPTDYRSRTIENGRI